MPVNVNDIEPDEKIVEIEMERLRSFRNHPFKVKADAEMLQLMESISKYGVMNPFCKSGSTSPKSTREITVNGDMTYTCDLAHNGSSIDIKNEKTEDNIAGSELEVIDVTGMVLSDAIKELEAIGFSNIRS